MSGPTDWLDHIYRWFDVDVYRKSADYWKVAA